MFLPSKVGYIQVEIEFGAAPKAVVYLFLFDPNDPGETVTYIKACDKERLRELTLENTGIPPEDLELTVEDFDFIRLFCERAERLNRKLKEWCKAGEI